MVIQIICFIGAMVTCFLIGRKTKKWKVPIMGELIFTNGNPNLTFKCDSFKDLQQYKYIAIEIKSRQNQHV